MTDRSIPAPRRWKDAVWRRFDRRFAPVEDVEQIAAELADVAGHVDPLLERSQVLERDMAEFAARLAELEARQGELRTSWEKALDRARDQTLRDIQDVGAISTMLNPGRPLPPLGGWTLAPDAARFLVEAVLQKRPDNAVECGSGSSTVLIAMAMERVGHGRLTSLEHDRDYLLRTEGLLASHGLLARVELLYAPLEPIEVDDLAIDWYRLPDDWRGRRTFDLVLVDGPPSTGKFDRYPALPLLLPYLSDRAFVVVDDAARPDETTMLELWRHRYPEFEAERLPHTKGTAVLRRRPVTGLSGRQQ